MLGTNRYDATCQNSTRAAKTKDACPLDLFAFIHVLGPVLDPLESNDGIDETVECIYSRPFLFISTQAKKYPSLQSLSHLFFTRRKKEKDILRLVLNHQQKEVKKWCPVHISNRPSIKKS